MRIAICEDDKVSGEYEKLLIHQWAEQKNHKISVDCYTSAENFLFESEDKIEYDFFNCKTAFWILSADFRRNIDKWQRNFRNRTGRLSEFNQCSVPGYNTNGFFNKNKCFGERRRRN